MVRDDLVEVAGCHKVSRLSLFFKISATLFENGNGCPCTDTDSVSDSVCDNSDGYDYTLPRAKAFVKIRLTFYIGHEKIPPIFKLASNVRNRNRSPESKFMQEL